MAPKEPKWPWRDLEDFRIGVFDYKSNYRRLNPDVWPCLRCGAHGYTTNNQLSFCYCPECRIPGKDRCTGEGTKEACEAEYNRRLKAYEETKEDYEKLVAAHDAALEKLTGEELKAVKAFS